MMNNYNEYVRSLLNEEYKKKTLMLEKVLRNVLMLSENDSKLLAKEIIDILSKYGLEIPNNVDKIKKVSLTDSPGLFNVEFMSGEQMKFGKIGKLLSLMYPHLDVNNANPKIQRVMEELKQLVNLSNDDVEFQIHSDVTNWYSKLATDCKVSSCVTDNTSDTFIKITKFLDDDPNIKIVIAFNKKTNKPIGRALLWNNVKGIDAPLLDRTYPEFNLKLTEIYHTWANEQGYYYRTSQDITNYHSISGKNRNIEYNTNKITNQIKVLPYMDTFRNGYINKDGHLVLTNSDEILKNEDVTKFVFMNTQGFVLPKHDEPFLKLNKQDRLQFIKKMVTDNIDITDEFISQITPSEFLYYCNTYIEYNDVLKLDKLTRFPSNNYQIPSDYDGYLYIRGMDSIQVGYKLPEQIKNKIFLKKK